MYRYNYNVYILIFCIAYILIGKKTVFTPMHKCTQIATSLIKNIVPAQFEIKNGFSLMKI